MHTRKSDVGVGEPFAKIQREHQITKLLKNGCGKANVTKWSDSETLALWNTVNPLEHDLMWKRCVQSALGMTKAESYYLNMNCPQKISSTIMFKKKKKEKKIQADWLHFQVHGSQWGVGIQGSN